MAASKKHTIALHPKTHRLASDLVAAGKFKTASDAVGCALTLLHEKMAVDAVPAAALRAAVRKGLASVRRGEWHEADDVFAEIEALDRQGSKRRKSA